MNRNVRARVLRARGAAPQNANVNAGIFGAQNAPANFRFAPRAAPGANANRTRTLKAAGMTVRPRQTTSGGRTRGTGPKATSGSGAGNQLAGVRKGRTQPARMGFIRTQLARARAMGNRINQRLRGRNA